MGLRQYGQDLQDEDQDTGSQDRDQDSNFQATSQKHSEDTS